MPVNPWSSENIEDYQHLMDEFGMRRFDPAGLRDMPMVMRRGTVVGQRGFHLIERAIRDREPYVMLTGLMPSGSMHLGHKMVMDQVVWYQRNGSDTFVAVADIEAFATRNLSLEKAREVAVEEYVKSYIALGLGSERCQIYFQSTRAAVKDMAYTFGRKANLTKMKEIYGFSDTVNLAHLFAPLVQVGDILHVQLPAYGGPRPTIVPVGLDQDPHIRFTRDLAQEHRIYSVRALADAPGLGVFLRGEHGDDRARELLGDAREALETAGYGDMKENLPYRALYVHGATESDLDSIPAILSAVELRRGGYGFYPPAGTYHRFMRGLTGGKMSSSAPETAIFLSDPPAEAAAKVRKAVTGGRQSVEEQRKLGGEPEKCSVFEMFLNHLVEDDAEVSDLYDRCRGGEQLCGACKKLASGMIAAFLEDFQERKAAVGDSWKEYVVDDVCRGTRDA